MVSVITEKLKFQNLREDECAGCSVTDCVTTALNSSLSKSILYPLPCNCALSSEMDCKNKENLDFLNATDSEKAEPVLLSGELPSMCQSATGDLERVQPPLDGQTSEAELALLLGPPCIAEGTALRYSHSYDNLPRPVAVRLTSSATFGHSMSNEEKGTNQNSTDGCEGSQAPNHQDSTSLTSLGERSAFKPIRAGEDSPLLDSGAQLYWVTQSPHERLSGHSVTPIDFSTMDCSQSRPPLFLHPQPTSTSDRPHSATRLLQKRCHSQPCLCKTYRCSSALCLLPLSGTPLNTNSNISSGVYRVRRSRHRFSRQLEQSSMLRRRRHSHVHSPGDLYVLSSGRSFLVGLPQFQSSPGRKARLLSELVSGNQQALPGGSSGQTVYRLSRPQSCVPVYLASTDHESCPSLDYPELDLNQIESN